MRVDRFEPSDLYIVNEWLEGHGEKRAHAKELPVFGFVARDEGGKPVAAGFLRQCEGGVGIFDSLVTDPERGPKARHAAIEALIAKILETARQLKMGRVIAFTRHPTIIERGKKHGFAERPHRLITLSL